MPSPLRRILILGATGLVGRELVGEAVARTSIEEIVALVRRDPGARPSTKVLYRVVDFDQLDGLTDALTVDAVLCALGTTRKATPDPAQYRHVEVELPLEVARRARAAGARRFGLVSSVGASPRSRSRYLRQKGELEEALAALDWERLAIIRPSLLAGARTEFRLAERLALAFGGLLPARYRPVDARLVARRLVAEVVEGAPGRTVVESGALHEG